jgi:hypothetical protein
MTKSPHDASGDAELALAVKAIEKQFGAGAVAKKIPPTRDQAQEDTAIARLATLAKIPADQERPYCRLAWKRYRPVVSCLAEFQGRMFGLLLGARQTALFRAKARGWADNRPVREAERAVRTACDAVRALSEPQRALFEKAFSVAAVGEELIEYDVAPGRAGLAMLEMLVEAFAVITGRSPTFELRGDRGGRPKGTVGNWQFRNFVGALWQVANECGGTLSFSCKENRGSGTMVEALEILRPLVPPDLIPLRPSAKTIESVKATLHTEIYWGFKYASNASMPGGVP